MEPTNKKAIFMNSPMPNHITMIGNNAATGAERKGSISGEKTALSFGDAPISTPSGMPITITSSEAAATRPTDHIVATANALLPSYQPR